MRSRKWLLVTPFTVLIVSIFGAQVAHTEPLTPLTPGELEYIEQLRKVFAAKHDPSAFRSDGELLTRGRFVCDQAAAGHVGQAATFQSPAITQLALIYLCP